MGRSVIAHFCLNWRMGKQSVQPATFPDSFWASSPNQTKKVGCEMECYERFIYVPCLGPGSVAQLVKCRSTLWESRDLSHKFLLTWNLAARLIVVVDQIPYQVYFRGRDSLCRNHYCWQELAFYSHNFAILGSFYFNDLCLSF